MSLDKYLSEEEVDNTEMERVERGDNFVGSKFNLNLINWKTEMKTRANIKFDDARKKIFLQNLLQYGKVQLACEAAGVSRRTVAAHRKKDDFFDMAFDDIIEWRSEQIVARIEHQAMEGSVDKSFDKEGNLVGERKKYETALRVKILERYGGEEYRKGSKSEVEVNLNKVLVAPAQADPADWAAEAKVIKEKQDKLIKENLD